MEERKEQVQPAREKKPGIVTKRMIITLAVVAAAVLLLVFAGLSIRNLRSYESALSLLRDAKYADAAEAFESLGEYRDASSYLFYTRAALAGEEGAFRTASDNLKSLNGFGDSAILAVYYEARALEEETLYEKAEPLYTQISLYRDAQSRLEAIPEKIQEREYQNACNLQDQGYLREALEIFRSLDDYRDSKARAEEISALTDDLKKAADYESADSLARANKKIPALEAFLALGDYRDSAARTDELKSLIYQEASQAAADGDVITAYSDYILLGDYLDSAVLAAGLENENNYQTAWKMALDGEYDQAYTAFLALGDYQDSAEKADTLWISQSARMKPIGEGLAVYEIENRVGLVNLKTNRITVACYESLDEFNSLGLARVGMNGLYGFIDDAGMTVIPVRYPETGEFDGNGLCLVKDTTGAYGYTDRTGNAVIPCKYQALSAFRNGVCVARNGELMGILNTEGEAVTGIIFSCIGEMNADSDILAVPSFDSQEVVPVANANHKYALMDQHYQVLGDFAWDEISAFSEGLARVRSGDYYGFIDVKGETVIAPVWRMADYFCDGLCVVSGGNNRYGFIDAGGNQVIPMVYDNVTRFRNGYASVYIPSVGWYMIDREGNNTRFAVVQYEQAMAALEKGEYETAASGFYALGDYGDAYQQMLESYYREALEMRDNNDLEDALWLASRLSEVAQYRDSEKLATAIMADRMYATGNTADAWQLYAQVDESLRRHQDDYQAMFEAADELLAAGKYDQAVAAFQTLGGYGESTARIEQAYDGKYQTEYAAALSLMEEEKYDEAINSFNALGEYSRAKEMTMECRYLRALAEEQKGDSDQARRWMAELGEYKDAADQVRRMQAEELFDAGKYAEAWTVFAGLREEYRTRDEDYERIYQAAEDLLNKGQFSEAEGAFLSLGTYRESADMISECRYRHALALDRDGFRTAAGELFLDLMNDTDGMYAELQQLQDTTAAAQCRVIMQYGGYRDAAEQFCRMYADERFEKGEYIQAWEIYAALDDEYHTHDADYQAMYSQAEKLEENGEFKAAEEAFRAIGSYRDSVQRAETAMQSGFEKTYQNAKALQEQGQFDEAYDLYASLNGYSDSDDKLLEVAVQKADNLYAEGRFAEASDIYRLLGNNDQAQDADWHEAERLKEAGDYQAAGEKWLQIAEYKDSREQHYRMAGERAEAQDNMTAILLYAADPDYKEAREEIYRIGTAAHEREDYETAVAAWNALGNYKDSGMNLTMDTYAYGGQLYDAKRYDEAAAVFQGMNGFSNTAERAQESAYQAACEALQAGEYADAESRFQALGKYSDSKTMVQEARYRAACAELEAGEYTAALDHFTEISTYKDSATNAMAARYALADQAYGKGQYREAVNGFSSIPGYRDADTRRQQARYMVYGEALAAGQFDEAISGFETLAAEGYVSALNEASRSHYLKAQALDADGETEEAYHEYVKAGLYEDAAEQAKARAYTMGAAYREKQAYEKAVEWFEIAGDYTDAKAQLAKIGEYYFSVQDWQNAINAYKTLGDDAQAAENLCRIGQYYDMQNDSLNAYLAYGYAGPDSGEGTARAAELRTALIREAEQETASGKTGKAVRIYEALARIDPSEYPTLIALDFESFITVKGRVLRIGSTDWKFLKEDPDGALVFIAAKSLSEGKYDTISDWLKSAKNKYFNQQEQQIISSLWVMSKSEVSQYMPSGDDRKVGSRGDIWTTTKNTGYTYSTYYYTYDGYDGSMSEYDYNRSSESCGIRPALRIRCSWMDLLQLIQSDADRYAFFDGSTKTAYNSEYLQAYAAAAEADQLKRYRRAMTLLERGEYDEASDMFAGLGDYQESARMVTECAYQKALRMVENGREEEAVAALEALNGYSDSSNQIELAKERIRGKRYAAAEQLEKEGRYAEAYDIFADADMEAFGDSPARAAVVADKAAEQKRQKDYADAAELYASGKLEEAEAIYQALGDYRDSAAKLAETQNAIRTRDYAAAKEALEKADFARAVELLSNLGDYQDSRTLLAEAQTGLIYDQALANAYAGKLTEAYQGFTTLGSFRDSAKKAEIVGNLSRAGKTQKLAEGVLIYEFHGLWGIANMNTNVITPVKYTSITFEQNSRYAGLGLAKVYISGGEPYSSRYIHALDTYGYINMDGEEVIPCSYLFITDFNTAKQCTVAKLKEDASGSYYYNRVLFGIIDSQGNTVTRTQWRTMGESANLDWNDSDQANQWYASDFTVSSPSFTDGRMKVQNPDGLWGFIDGQGKVLGEVKWVEIGSFSDGMAKVSQKVSIGSGYSKTTVTRYGFINEQGQTIGEVRWEAVNNFSQGLAAVKEDGKWGFIDRTNTLVIPCRYTEVNAFKTDGTCDVRNPDGTWIVIDKKGDSVFFGN